MNSLSERFRKFKFKYFSPSTKVDSEEAEITTEKSDQGSAIYLQDVGGEVFCGDDSSLSSRGSADQSGTAERFFPSPILNMDSKSTSLPEFPGDAVLDCPVEEDELGSVEDQKSVLLHLLSQLKMGMDLTKIVLPTFILEKRSLLEMFADYLAHPDFFIQISRGPDPESRMLSFVQWYLTAFHVGRKDKITRKPYNPIIGESFHCCWMVSSNGKGVEDSSNLNPSEDPVLITYCAEQVSHHPPVTAFHFSLPAYDVELSSAIHTKSKFQGMSVSVTMVGKTVLRLGQHGEEYHFTFPTAYARSILTTPWVELGDKVTITCPQTGYTALIMFHTKPLRSNKIHRISGEVFAPSHVAPGERSASPCVIARVSGEWNGILEFERYTKGGMSWSVNVQALPIVRKLVRPVENQRPEESRRLWQQVSNALKSNNVLKATEYKRELEERQRVSEKCRIRRHIPFPVKFFDWNGTTWVFRQPSDSPPSQML